MNILVDNKKVNFTEDDFPMLISDADKSGSSFFSISLLATLFKSGMKVLLFSAYPMAKEEFRKQIGDNEENTIIIDSGEEQALIDSVENTPNLSERIVLIKNIDTYSSKLFDVVKNLKLIIFSGDLDKCQFADELIKKEFATKIFFSQSEKFPQEEPINLAKYCGKIISEKHEGIISLGNN